MARETKIVTITAEGKDKGKHFFIEEMPPRRSERWAFRAVLAIASGSNPAEIDLSDIAGTDAWAVLLSAGIKSFFGMKFADAEPLLDEMLECVWYIPDMSKIDQHTKRPLIRPVDWDNDVDQAMTITALRSEVIEVHTGFSVAAFLSLLGKTAKARLNTPDTSTSPSL